MIDVHYSSYRRICNLGLATAAIDNGIRAHGAHQQQGTPDGVSSGMTSILGSCVPSSTSGKYLVELPGNRKVEYVGVGNVGEGMVSIDYRTSHRLLYSLPKSLV